MEKTRRLIDARRVIDGDRDRAKDTERDPPGHDRPRNVDPETCLRQGVELRADETDTLGKELENEIGDGGPLRHVRRHPSDQERAQHKQREERDQRVVGDRGRASEIVGGNQTQSGTPSRRL